MDEEETDKPKIEERRARQQQYPMRRSSDREAADEFIQEDCVMLAMLLATTMVEAAAQGFQEANDIQEEEILRGDNIRVVP